ncbi:ArnT family glycosyltransferase [Klenkia terrae]|uniref:ArnT family glycosyltransferase n=1 Tax=Klenkia terrae TaxID=1052259 RepID=UPI0036226B3C
MSTVLDPPVGVATPVPAPLRAGDPGWVRPALLTLLGATGVLYVWDLAASGWANAFYAAAVQAGSQSWSAAFYGASDAAGAITVDKPPASLWVMEASVRLFGLSSWSLLVPQALMGVATTGVVYLAVRRVVGPGAGLLAGAASALTPVAVLMFRFDNPDALLVLLLTLAAYLLTRAVQSGRRATLVAVGVLIGFAFLTKTLQAFLVVPGFALVWLVCAPTVLRRRLVDLAWATLAMVVAGGWWVLVVELVPADWRPYIGGSQTNSVWELIWGYNGLGRLTGDETGSVGGTMGWGETGLGRMFDAEIGGQISWLLPAALVLAVAGLVAVGRRPRTDPARAGLLVWTTWLLATGLTFSLMAGIFHAYYTVALAPAIAAVVGIGGGLLWARRGSWWARLVLAGTLAGTGVWSWVLLTRTPSFVPWVAPLVLAAALLGAGALLGVHRLPRPLVGVVVALGTLAALGGPAAYAVDTASAPHTGSIVTAGPTGISRFGNAPARPASTAPSRTPVPAGPGSPRRREHPRQPGRRQRPQRPGRRRPARERVVVHLGGSGDRLAERRGVPAGHRRPGDGGRRVQRQRPLPTLAEFQQYVAAGDIHWFVGGSVGRSSSGSSSSADIQDWVAQNYPASTVDGVTLYDLSRRID